MFSNIKTWSESVEISYNDGKTNRKHAEKWNRHHVLEGFFKNDLKIGFIHDCRVFFEAYIWNIHLQTDIRMSHIDIYVGGILSFGFYLMLQKMHFMFGIDNEKYNA